MTRTSETPAAAPRRPGLFNLFRRFRRDRRAGIAITGALVMASTLMATGIATDSGLIYVHIRKAQGATDLAALIAVGALTEATRAAGSSLVDNGFAQRLGLTVTTGRYEADAGRTPGGRFVAGAPRSNAVKVSMTTQPPVVFWNAFVSRDRRPQVTTEAIAVTTSLATMSMGTRLASLHGGVVNGILNGLLGSSLSLDVMDYNALLDARVDMLDVLDRLDTRLTLAGDTYGDLLDATVGEADLAYAVEDVLRNGGATGRVLTALHAIAGAGSESLALGELISLGPMETLTVGGARGGLAAKVSAFDVVFAALRLADGRNALVLEVGLDTVLAGLTLKLAIGEPMQHTGWVEIGDAGTTIHSAQTRLYLEARVGGGTGLLGGLNLSVPIYAEAAAGVAELSSVACAGSATTVDVSARPGLAEAWIGAIDPSRLPSFGSTIAPAPARLLNAPLVKIDAYADAEIANPTAHTLTFTLDDINAGRLKTVGTHSILSSLLSSLVSNADITVTIGGFGLGLPGPLKTQVGALLGTIAAPLDAVIAGALRTAGVGVGEMDVIVGGVRCFGPALVL